MANAAMKVLNKPLTAYLNLRMDITSYLLAFTYSHADAVVLIHQIKTILLGSIGDPILVH